MTDNESFDKRVGSFAKGLNVSCPFSKEVLAAAGWSSVGNPGSDETVCEHCKIYQVLWTPTEGPLRNHMADGNMSCPFLKDIEKEIALRAENGHVLVSREETGKLADKLTECLEAFEELADHLPDSEQERLGKLSAGVVEALQSIKVLVPEKEKSDDKAFPWSVHQFEVTRLVPATPEPPAKAERNGEPMEGVESSQGQESTAPPSTKPPPSSNQEEQSKPRRP